MKAHSLLVSNLARDLEKLWDKHSTAILMAGGCEHLPKDSLFCKDAIKLSLKYNLTYEELIELIYLV